MHRAPRGNGEAGSWRPLTIDGKRSASMYCPRCGKGAYLDGHTIDAQGSVSPSVVCPHTLCDFHEFVLLEGWPG